jgi:serine/threonine-protein kinase
VNPDDLLDGGHLQDTDLEGGPPEPPKAPDSDSVGRYLLLGKLGRGGSGEVYRAMDTQLNREVALKRLRIGDFEQESRFLREAELLALLSHPSIMPIFDFGRDGDSYFYTMPLAPGMSLDQWMTRRKPPLREAVRIIGQAAEALAYAHERGVLHRDVKPANILVTDPENALLADFGLGRMESAEPRMTESGQVMGTPGYMAPEFASGDLKGADARCDIYALGATLYEAITGRPPHVGFSSLEILKNVILEDPPPPRKLAPSTPVDLEIICMKALSREPGRRYATAREMAEDLSRFLAGKPILARRPTAAYRASRFVKAHRTVVTVAAIALAAVAGIGAFALWRAGSDSARHRKVTDILEQANRHANAVNELMRTRSESDAEVARQAGLAFEEIDKAMAAEPGNPDAHFLRGRVHSLRFEKDEARRCYDEAITRGPVARAYLERAHLDCMDLVIQRKSGARTRIEDLRENVRRDLKEFMSRMADPPELEFAQALLDLSALDSAGFAKAVDRLQAYADHTRDWRAYYWKGVAELESLKFKEARGSLETALDSRRACRISASILDRLGLACFLDDQAEEAERRFREAIERDPELAAPKVNLASMCLELDRIDEATRLSESALELDRSLPQAHAIRGQCYVLAHQRRISKEGPEACLPLLRSARESLEAALRSFPRDSEQGAALGKDLEYVLRNLDY